MMRIYVSLLVFLIFGSFVQGQWLKVIEFEHYAVGESRLKDYGWSSGGCETGDCLSIVNVPFEPSRGSEKALSARKGTYYLTLPREVPEGSKATFYMHAAVGREIGNRIFGVFKRMPQWPRSFRDEGAYLSWGRVLGVNQGYGGTLAYNNPDLSDPEDYMDAQQWYDIWLQIDNQPMSVEDLLGSRFDLYVKGGIFEEITHLRNTTEAFEDAGITAWSFTTAIGVQYHLYFKDLVEQDGPEGEKWREKLGMRKHPIFGVQVDQRGPYPWEGDGPGATYLPENSPNPGVIAWISNAEASIRFDLEDVYHEFHPYVFITPAALQSDPELRAITQQALEDYHTGNHPEGVNPMGFGNSGLRGGVGNGYPASLVSFVIFGQATEDEAENSVPDAFYVNEAAILLDKHTLSYPEYNSSSSMISPWLNYANGIVDERIENDVLSSRPALGWINDRDYPFIYVYSIFDYFYIYDNGKTLDSGFYAYRYDIDSWIWVSGSTGVTSDGRFTWYYDYGSSNWDVFGYAP